MSTKISTGDTVEVLEHGSADSHMLGVKGRVIDVYPKHEYRSPTNVMVEDPTGNGMWLREGGVRGWWFRVTDVKKVEEYLAEWEKELLGIETKQEIEAGDTVKVIDKVGGHGLEVGSTHTVKAVEDPEDGKFAMIVLDAPGTRTASYAKRFELVSKAVVEAEKPKARSQEISVEDVQVGDTVVAFWNQNGVEYRQKATVHEIYGGCPWTSDGGLITHNRDNVLAEHIYLIDRPEVKEPEFADGTYWVVVEDEDVRIWWKVEVKDSKATWGIRGDMSDVACADYGTLVRSGKGDGLVVHTTHPFPAPKGFDALDKTVKYFLKGRDGATDFVLEVVGGDWKYGWVGDNTRVNAKQYEKGFTEGNGAWEKPVPYEPTDLEKHIEAGTIGNRYRSGRVEYKVTKKGRVKGIITNDPLDTWANVHWPYETFKDHVDRGTIYKI